MKTLFLTTAAFAALVALAPIGTAHAGAPAAAPSEHPEMQEAFCRDHWTTRGVLNDEMFAYCVDKQHEGYLALVADVAKYADQVWMQPVVDAAGEKWTKRDQRQNEMVAYTVHKQIEGLLDLNYAREQPSWNEAKADECVSKWQYNFDMAAFCYKDN